MNNHNSEMSEPERIAASLVRAAADIATRKARISTLLARHPDGYIVAGWSKITIDSNVFWHNGREYLTGGQLLETLGTKLVKAGALTEEEYYG